MAPLSEGRRATYHHGALKPALLDAAARLVAERGPEGFSLLDAARACGVGASAPYRHFADKAALLRGLAQRGQGLMAEFMAGAWAAGADPRGGFAGMGQAYLRFAREHPGEYAAMFATRGHGFQPDGPGTALLHQALAAQGYSPQELWRQIWAISHGAAMLERSGMLDAEDSDAVVRDGVARLLRGAAA